jgi:hypothetical protein
MVAEPSKEPHVNSHPVAGLPTDDLEWKAEEQRRRLHQSVEELKTRVRKNLDINQAAGEFILPLSAGAALLSLAAGYAFAGMFTRR